jgi:peptide/nickel transport system ATP-binding protein
MALLEVEGLRTYFDTMYGMVRAVDDVSFSVEKGEAFGLAGESGSGKTTAALSIMRLIKPPGRILNGRVLFEGENLLEKTPSEMDEIRWKRISMIFQGAMNALNPVYKIGDQIVEAIVHHERTPKEEALTHARELLRIVGIDESRVDNYPHEFSGGMKQRAMIAMALALNPDLVIADEPTTALDVIIQRQIIDLINGLRRNLNLSLILITHDLSVIMELCEKVGIFYAGKLVEVTDTRTLLDDPLHPYSRGLVQAFPTIDGVKERLTAIEGSPPSLIDPPSGCRFHPRCPRATDVCRKVEPELVEVEPGHRHVACHNVG